MCMGGGGEGSLPSSIDLIQVSGHLSHPLNLPTSQLKILPSSQSPVSNASHRPSFAGGWANYLSSFSQSCPPSQICFPRADSPPQLSSGTFGKPLGVTKSWSSNFFYCNPQQEIHVISQPITYVLSSMCVHAHTHTHTQTETEASTNNTEYLP